MTKGLSPCLIPTLDNCDAVLNTRDGFTDWRPEWTCAECGRMNYI